MDELEFALTRMRTLQDDLWKTDPSEMRLARRLGYLEQIDTVLEALRPMMVATRCRKGLKQPCETCGIYKREACADGAAAKAAAATAVVEHLVSHKDRGYDERPADYDDRLHAALLLAVALHHEGQASSRCPRGGPRVDPERVRRRPLGDQPVVPPRARQDPRRVRDPLQRDPRRVRGQRAAHQRGVRHRGGLTGQSAAHLVTCEDA